MIRCVRRKDLAQGALSLLVMPLLLVLFQYAVDSGQVVLQDIPLELLCYNMLLTFLLAQTHARTTVPLSLAFGRTRADTLTDLLVWLAVLVGFGLLVALGAMLLTGLRAFSVLFSMLALSAALGMVGILSGVLTLASRWGNTVSMILVMVCSGCMGMMIAVVTGGLANSWANLTDFLSHPAFCLASLAVIALTVPWTRRLLTVTRVAL